jgi:2-methylisocitrate lyase-like PEP mutase family enzyme
MTQLSMTGKSPSLDQQVRQAEIFASLHRPGDPLLLPNAWDVASAVMIASAGAKAIATTSAGVAWSLGVRDAADLGPHRASRTSRAVRRSSRRRRPPGHAPVD